MGLTTIDQLFQKKLLTLSTASLQRWCYENHCTPGNIEWTDEAGKCWTALSRLGFLWLTRKSPPRATGLMPFLLDAMIARHKENPTPATEESLAWGWLGIQRLKTLAPAWLHEPTNNIMVQFMGRDMTVAGTAQQWKVVQDVFDQVAHLNPSTTSGMPLFWVVRNLFFPGGISDLRRITPLHQNWTTLQTNQPDPLACEQLTALLHKGWTLADASREQFGLLAETESSWWIHWNLWGVCSNALDDATWAELGMRTLAHMERGWPAVPDFKERITFVAMRGLLLRPLDAWASADQQSRLWDCLHREHTRQPKVMPSHPELLAWYEQRLLRHHMSQEPCVSATRPRL